MILKLQSESKNSHSKNVFFEQFDTKFARTEYFGYEAIIKAIDNAIDKKFIDLNLCICDEIEPTENSRFLDDPTIEKVLNYLKENSKVIVIFFDHFDHLLRKPRLESTFDFFENLIHEFSYDKTNIVLGFSWTSATSLCLDPNIRHRWEKLTTETMEVLPIEEFVPREAKEFIKIFRKRLKYKSPKIKIIEKWLEEKCSPFPWLLRRLLNKFYNHKVDSYFTIKNQEIRELVINMLKDDLKKLQPREYECLKKIANFESNIFESYEKEIQVLIEKLFIIPSDYEYIVRDDILREYILTKDITLPDLSITYIPKRPVDFILNVFRLLKTEITKKELMTKIIECKMIRGDFESRNVDNILSDLRHFFQVEYDTETKSIKIKQDLLDLDDHEISNHLRGQLQEHLVIKEIYKNKHKIKPGEYFTRDMLAELVRTLYPTESLELYTDEDVTLPLLSISTKKKVKIRDKSDHYTSRLLSWFRFAGIIEQGENSIFLIPTNRLGKEKGKIIKEETTEDAKQLELF